ncbi:MAG: bifunctional diaminohydroxyphosphoribosylaminopyrimidine deaminase/5-amino-6-(5-phosphoribosylamino)uracil reductase RibD [Saprospiraceae bacterium]
MASETFKNEKEDRIYMQRCFELARLGAGSVSPNPMVGAVLVYQNRIIGEGWHKAYGEAHAEVNCFNSVNTADQQFIPEATLYCSLEPCSHVGKTPPCADLILKMRPKRVVIANIDPNPQVAGKGLAKIGQAGIEVIQGVLDDEGKWLNRTFFTSIEKKRPYVILKWAKSKDGYLGKAGHRTPISNPLTNRMTHRWRSEVDAILVGANTAQIDDPELSVRHFSGKNPLRVLLDGKASVSANRKLLADNEPTLILGAPRSSLNEVKRLKHLGPKISIQAILDTLMKEKRHALLVEGGAQVHAQFLSSRLWDEIRIIENPKLLGSGVLAPQLPENIKLVEEFTISSDLISVYKNIA